MVKQHSTEYYDKARAVINGYRDELASTTPYKIGDIYKASKVRTALNTLHTDNKLYVDIRDRMLKNVPAVKEFFKQHQKDYLTVTKT